MTISGGRVRRVNISEFNRALPNMLPIVRFFTQSAEFNLDVTPLFQNISPGTLQCQSVAVFRFGKTVTVLSTGEPLIVL